MCIRDRCRKMRSLWEEFEACETKEAKFARTMDNLQPVMLNAVSYTHLVMDWEKSSLPTWMNRLPLR